MQSFHKTEDLPLDDRMRIRLLYAQGRALESRNDGAAIGKFRECLSLIGEGKGNELYLSALFHLARNQQAASQYSAAIESLTRILQADCNDKCVY